MRETKKGEELKAKDDNVISSTLRKNNLLQ